MIGQLAQRAKEGLDQAFIGCGQHSNAMAENIYKVFIYIVFFINMLKNYKHRQLRIVWSNDEKKQTPFIQ